MTFLPIVGRELRVRTSQAGFRWLRVALAGFAVLACLQWFNFNLASFTAAGVGPQSFAMLARLAFVLALGAVLLTADCVSGERRDGTLGLLFLSTLRSREIVLGKLAVSGLTALYAMLGFLPVLLLPLLAGGLTGGQVFRTALALLNLLFVSLATGLAVSVFVRTQIQAIVGAVFALTLVCLLPAFGELISRDWLGWQLTWLSPITSFLNANPADYQRSPTTPFWYWCPLALSHALGWALVGLASLALARNWPAVFQARALKAPPPQVRGLLGAPRMFLSGTVQRKRAFAPVARAMLRMPGQQGPAWLGACLSVVGSFGATAAMRGLGSVWAAMSVNAVFGFMSAAMFAFVGGRFLFEARRNGELELLLVTPAGARGILREQRFALVRLLRCPFYFAVVGTIPVAASAAGANSLLGLAQGLSYIGGVASGVLAAAWMGAWVATWARNQFSLVGWVVGLVELAPIAAAYLLPVVLLGGQVQLFAAWIMILPTLFVVKNLVFVAYARARLRREFRVADGIRFDWFRARPGTSVLPAPDASGDSNGRDARATTS